MRERRKQARTRSYLGGRIVFFQRRCTVDCLVRNLSEDGALLVMHDTGTVPERFELDVGCKAQTYATRLVWRREDRAGVAFIAPEASANVVPLAAARRIRTLEAEKSALEQQLTRLSSES